MLRSAGKNFGILMVFFVGAVFIILTVAIGYGKGWATPIDSWGMPLDVIFVTIFLAFMITGMFVVILKRNPY